MGLKKETFGSPGYTYIPTTESEISYQFSEISTESNVDFGISRSISESSEYKIWSPNRESEKTTGDSEPTINFD